jgi:hypothetical protein
LTGATMPIDDFVAEFGAEVDAQAAALFVGAGLSMLAGYPSWSALVEPYGRELGVTIAPDPSVTPPDFPLLVQYFEDSRADAPARVRADIIRLIRETDASPTEAHRQLLALPVPDIWTTNYDDLIEHAAETMDLKMAVFVEDEDLAESSSAEKRLHKMHGSVTSAAASRELVIARDDFERYPTSHPRLWHLLRASFLTRSFLFLGFSLTDPNITDIFRIARLYTATVPRTHYVVLARSSTDASIAKLRFPDLARVGIRVVEVDHHQDVATVLARLHARCRPPRAYISGSPSNDKRDWTSAFVEALSALVAADPLIRMMAGGELGSSLGYAVSKKRFDSGAYHSDDFVVIRRVSDGELTPPNTRWGSVIFDGEEAEGLRSAAFERVRAVLVLGGGGRSREEIGQARELGLGVIAVGGSGGAAAEQWAADVSIPADVRLGERPVDVDDLNRLNHSDPATAADSAFRLLRQGLFLA